MLFKQNIDADFITFKANRVLWGFLIEVNYGGDAKQILLLLVFNLRHVQIYVYRWLLGCAALDVTGCIWHRGGCTASGREARRSIQSSAINR